MLGGLYRSITIPFDMEKLYIYIYIELCCYPTVKKFDEMFTRFDRIPACDRQVDRRTDGHIATA